MTKLFPRIAITLGVWVVVSPWVLGFYNVTPALWSSVASGAIVALVGLWELFGSDEGSGTVR